MGAPRRHAAVYLLGLPALLLGVPACSGAAGTDFGADAASRDATTVVDTSSGEMDAASPVVEAASRDDGSVGVDSSASVEGGVVPDAGDVGEAGGDEAGPSLCSMICMGCCDSQGKCRAGTAVALCGGKGGTCEDCSKKQCPLTETGCCGGGGCGCAIGGLVGCN